MLGVERDLAGSEGVNSTVCHGADVAICEAICMSAREEVGGRHTSRTAIGRLVVLDEGTTGSRVLKLEVC